MVLYDFYGCKQLSFFNPFPTFADWLKSSQVRRAAEQELFDLGNRARSAEALSHTLSF